MSGIMNKRLGFLGKVKLSGVCPVLGFLLLSFLFIGLVVPSAHAIERRYTGGEVKVYVTPGEPTLVKFPGVIAGGYKRGNSALSLDRQKDSVVLFAKPGLPLTGEALLIQLKDERSYSLRVLPSTSERPRDTDITIIDSRTPAVITSTGVGSGQAANTQGSKAPKSAISSLMSEMIKVAEFGKRTGITGYRRSNNYSW